MLKLRSISIFFAVVLLLAAGWLSEKSRKSAGEHGMRTQLRTGISTLLDDLYASRPDREQVARSARSVNSRYLRVLARSSGQRRSGELDALMKMAAGLVATVEGKHSDAAGYFKDPGELPPGGDKSLWALGARAGAYAAYSRQDWQGAVDLFDPLIESGRSGPEILTFAAACYSSLGLTEKADALLERAGPILESRARSLIARGDPVTADTVLSQLQDIREARMNADDDQSMATGLVTVYLMRARLMMVNSAYADALTLFEKSWLRSRSLSVPESADFINQSLLGMGSASLMIGQPVAAEKYFREAGASAVGSINHAVSLTASNRLQQGIDILKSLASAADPQIFSTAMVRPAARMTLGVVSSFRGNHSQASGYFDSAIQALESLPDGADGDRNKAAGMSIPMTLLQLTGGSLEIRLMGTVDASGMIRAERSMLGALIELNRLFNDLAAGEDSRFMDQLPAYRDGFRAMLSLNRNQGQQFFYAKSLNQLAAAIQKRTSPERDLLAAAMDMAGESASLMEWKNPLPMETAAGIAAAGGDFTSAVKWQTAAIDLMPEQGRESALSRLTDYRQGRGR